MIRDISESKIQLGKFFFNFKLISISIDIIQLLIRLFNFRYIIPKKKPRGDQLNMNDRDRNNKVSSDRVIIKTVFGCMRQSFGVMHRKYGWSRDKLDDIAVICLSQTNFHIYLHPLREEDRAYYLSILSALKVMSDETRKKGLVHQLCYNRQRQHGDDVGTG